MDQLMEQLVKTENEWQEYADIAASFLKKAPEGKIKIKPCHKKYYQYFISDSDDSLPCQYAGPEKAGLIEQLMQKEYCHKTLDYLDTALKKIQSFIQWYEPDKVSKLYEKLPEARKKYITPLKQPDSVFLDEWLSGLRPFGNTIPSSLEILTNNGEAVRSKSEKIIADKFFELGIPYVYESPLTLSGLGTIYPDFTVLNVRLRKTFYFEHFGLMNDPGYAESVLKKIHAYENNDYWFGDGLLYTFEMENVPLNTRILEKMICQYLL